jgi:DNA uptake protein ComE-like DNA-binding protein
MSDEMKAPCSSGRWPWLSLLPCGLGAWAPIYAGVKARVASWIALGAAWCVIAIVGFAIAGDHRHNAFAGMLLMVAWIGAVVTSFAIRPAYDQRVASPLQTAAAQAVLRLRDREQARALARSDPTLAREIGIGRPDLHGAADAGLVDFNHASAAALASVPAIGTALAKRIVETRAQVGGFSSVEELGDELDLDGDLVEHIRDQAVFVPR